MSPDAEGKRTRTGFPIQTDRPIRTGESNVSTRKCTATVSVTIQPQTVLGDAIYAAGGFGGGMTIESNAVELKDATVEGRCVLVVRTHSERGSESSRPPSSSPCSSSSHSVLSKFA